MLLIYTNQLTPRVKYTFRFFLGKLLGLDYRITDDLDEFNVSHYPRITYTHQPVEGIPFIQARSLLFEKGIVEQNIHISEWETIPVFYSTGKQSLLPFDPFAAAFYMVSRYEEYLPYISDSYGRFPSEESFAFKNNFLHLPIVNIWANKFCETIGKIFPSLTFNKPIYSSKPTIDIDNAWAYLEKGLFRTIGAVGLDFKNKDFNNLKRRILTLLSKEKDIYDTYKYMAEIHKSAGLEPIFFFLLGDYSKLDRNVRYNNRNLSKLIKSIADDNLVGIHPSYQSNFDSLLLKKEIDRLSNITNRPVKLSRQHFLKLSFPNTFRNLLEMDIREDFSLGYADRPGFRAGTTVPFFFFDLDQDQETPLLLHPITVMDATLNRYLNLNPDQAITKVKELKQTVAKYGGQFMPLWHNETLSESFEWKGWRRVYEEALK